MTVFVVKIGRLFVGSNRDPEPPEGTAKGWRPLVWAKKVIDAEKFNDPSSAHLWAKTWLEHDDFVVTSVGSSDGPGLVA